MKIITNIKIGFDIHSVPCLVLREFKNKKKESHHKIEMFYEIMFKNEKMIVARFLTIHNFYQKTVDLELLKANGYID